VGKSCCQNGYASLIDYGDLSLTHHERARYSDSDEDLSTDLPDAGVPFVRSSLLHVSTRRCVRDASTVQASDRPRHEQPHVVYRV
jgi:hypothetical protein